MMADPRGIAPGEFLPQKHNQEPGNRPRTIFWDRVHGIAPEVADSLQKEVLPIAKEARGALLRSFEDFSTWAGYRDRVEPPQDWGLEHDPSVSGVVQVEDALLCLSGEHLHLLEVCARVDDALNEWAARFGIADEPWAVRTAFETPQAWVCGPNDEVFDEIRTRRRF